MILVFWQNIISIHQASFLYALSQHHEVILVVEEDLENERKVQGWSIPNLGGISVIISPSEIEIEKLLNSSAIHVFSGIAAYPMVNKAFRLAVKKGLKVGVMMEPFKWIGLKGKIRWIKYYYLKLRFNKKINFILPTGELGVHQYLSLGFDKDKIFDWAYFVEPAKLSLSKEKVKYATSKPSILFVGSIDERKNIIPQIDKIRRFKDSIEKMTIIGDGPLRENLQDKIKDDLVFELKGVLSNDQVKELMAQHDILILPSKFDGWGAVVNEALHAGMRVIASENCGAAILLDGEVRGESFQFNGENDFEKVLLRWIKKGNLTHQERQVIKEWSETHISGKAAATYFERILDYTYNRPSERPIAPWRT